MSIWLFASYSLRIRKIYENVKDRIPGKLRGTFSQDRKVILNYVLPLVRDSYRQGIDLGKAHVKKTFSQEIEVSYQVNSKVKENLFREFILLMKNAADIYEMKMKHRERLLSVEKRIKKRTGSDLDIITREYENGVKLAINDLILNAGEQGMNLVYRAARIKRES